MFAEDNVRPGTDLTPNQYSAVGIFKWPLCLEEAFRHVSFASLLCPSLVTQRTSNVHHAVAGTGTTREGKSFQMNLPCMTNI